MDFSSIRPFNNAEFVEKKDALKTNPLFFHLLSYYLTEPELPALRSLLDSITTIQEFQQQIIRPLVGRILTASTNGLTVSGLDKLSKTESYLFITNHRDIVLDSALINCALLDEEFSTCQIAIGNNLVKQPILRDIALMNKNFLVERELPKDQLYSSSLRLSSYIQKVIIQNEDSIWLAQREGRAKDGHDKTAPGLLKMLTLSADTDIISHVKKLNIVPVTISYQFDPCDALKARELRHIRDFGAYKKALNEDEQSMVTGLLGNKGAVHLEFGKVLNGELDSLVEIKNKNELIRNIAGLIDRQIYSNYRFWKENYIAFDQIQKSKFSDQYDTSDKEEFIDYLKEQAERFNMNWEKGKEILFANYANSLINHISI